MRLRPNEEVANGGGGSAAGPAIGVDPTPVPALTILAAHRDFDVSDELAR